MLLDAPGGMEKAASRHDTTRHLLAHHVAADAKEEHDLALMQRVLETVPAPFSRRSFPHHFTASAVIVTPDRDRVLLVHHRRLDRWLQPGGHFEAPDADPLTAALREAQEETGLACTPHPDAMGLLDVDAHRIPGKDDEPDHYHLDLRFLVRAERDAPIHAHVGETKEVRWFTVATLGDLALEGEMARLLGKAIHR